VRQGVGPRSADRGRLRGRRARPVRGHGLRPDGQQALRGGEHGKKKQYIVVVVVILIILYILLIIILAIILIIINNNANSNHNFININNAKQIILALIIFVLYC
jgi:hypothetical protein